MNSIEMSFLMTETRWDLFDLIQRFHFDYSHLQISQDQQKQQNSKLLRRFMLLRERD